MLGTIIIEDCLINLTYKAHALRQRLRVTSEGKSPVQLCSSGCVRYDELSGTTDSPPEVVEVVIDAAFTMTQGLRWP